MKTQDNDKAALEARWTGITVEPSAGYESLCQAGLEAFRSRSEADHTAIQPALQARADELIEARPHQGSGAPVEPTYDVRNIQIPALTAQLERLAKHYGCTPQEAYDRMLRGGKP